MCDTFGQINKGYSIFGKNSDRSPNEPQIIQYIERHSNKDKKLKATYITIDQVPEVYSIFISRPSWMWGCEMGVNEFGLCIGNEAVFTKGKYNKTGLTGMDLVRLGLERATNALEAKEIIISLIEKYGQGGNCGYDHDFYYDNSFLIMDRNRIIILETHNKEYCFEEVKSGSISNCIKLEDLKNKESKIYKFFSGSAIRNGLVDKKMNKDIDVCDSFNILRCHSENNYFKKGSVKSPCMHAGSLVGDHTTSSMVVKVDKDITVYFTGTSLPCISMFKKYKFGDAINCPIFKTINTDYWYEQEFIKRKLIGKVIPNEYYEKRKIIEDMIINNNYNFKKQLSYEKELNDILLNSTDKLNLSFYCNNYWKKKNARLEIDYNG